MSRSVLSAEQLRRALSLRDLSDPAQGPHAMQLLIDQIIGTLAERWSVSVVVERASPLVSVRDNYDRLHYPEDGAARDARYTRYASEEQLLRTQTTAMIPPLLERIAGDRDRGDLLLVCPGLVYRRDAIDRLHTGEPHQMDLWRVRCGEPLSEPELEEMIRSVIGAALPGRALRSVAALHPYTLRGRQIDVETPEGWVEVGECGLALPELLEECGLDRTRWSGLAMGLGLDRLLMLRKGIDDIRILRSSDPRIARQLLDLEAPYQRVSAQPPIRRDLSIAVDAAVGPEELGDRVRDALGAERAASIEAIEVLSETAYQQLPEAAIARIGMSPNQKNLLIRVVLRDLERTLTDPEANALRDAIYAVLHEGAVHQWTIPKRTGGSGIET